MYPKSPKYVEVYSKLKQAIYLGEFPAGSFLPTENELMERFQVSKTTVRHAVQLLREHNLVEVRQGSGTKILFTEQKSVTSSKYQNPGSTTSISVHYTTDGEGAVNNTKAVSDLIPASEAVAQALQVPEGELVYRFQRLQLVDGLTFSYMVNYISQSVAPNLSDRGDLITDLYGHLEKNYGIHVEKVTETIDVMVAGFMEAQFLQAAVGAPLLLLKRVATSGEQIVEYCETIARPDIFHMTINISQPDSID